MVTFVPETAAVSKNIRPQNGFTQSNRLVNPHGVLGKNRRIPQQAETTKMRHTF
ncbi:MAG: hypothetical protein MUD08_12015 [Cytophagales bacterium]|nr:hypothetical protein [Cytophagales bacterium]